MGSATPREATTNMRGRARGLDQNPRIMRIKLRIGAGFKRLNTHAAGLRRQLAFTKLQWNLDPQGSADYRHSRRLANTQCPGIDSARKGQDHGEQQPRRRITHRRGGSPAI
jgi:hypothetical protein